MGSRCEGILQSYPNSAAIFDERRFRFNLGVDRHFDVARRVRLKLQKELNIGNGKNSTFSRPEIKGLYRRNIIGPHITAASASVSCIIDPGDQLLAITIISFYLVQPTIAHK